MPRMILSPAGSSPLTRGKRRRRSRRLQAARLIPAHAGKTRGAGRVAPRPSAHPRSRGENNPNLLKEAPPVGSSPLTRGKRDRALEVLGPWRLIPAHAGKTRIRRPTSSLRSAHPRSRGENTAFFRWAHGAGGSSPLMRGKLGELVHFLRGHRLIPAHAGKTVVEPVWTNVSTAHPRSRGENAREMTGLTQVQGSSPLTRGKLGEGRGGPGCQRLIPAHAGKTRAWSWCRWSPAAHPRSRGENMRPERSKRYESGSSPLTRGKPRPQAVGSRAPGLIPAHAGKTPRPASRGALGWAHPRSRGENHDQDAYPDPRPGSSPLTRGKPAGQAVGGHRRGLIPAHAGKTLRIVG